ncbi:MAG: histidine phosphatase family protein [Oscillospiraceae bacterium]|nr:histidine phosphatase family protein [Oscillospiraceae bacterium]
MRLIFVRHGEPNYDKDCLTANGRQQAERTAERLRSEPISAVYASPMGRTVETASFTAELHGLEVQKLDFMHEIDWGGIRDADGSKTDVPYGGHPWTLGYKLLTENPELVGSPESWREHPYFRDNRCMAYYDRIAGEIDAFLAGFGLHRKNGLYECRKPCDDTVALFAHGGSGAVLFSHVLHLPFPFVLTTLPYGVCSVSVFQFETKAGGMVIPRLELFNDMAHLGEVRAEKLRFEK